MGLSIGAGFNIGAGFTYITPPPPPLNGLYAWGYNVNGQLGNNDTSWPVVTPVQVGALTTWSQVDAGVSASVAIQNDGTLWAWGQNNFGQLGTGNITNRSSPVQVIGAETNWTSVSIGNLSTAAIKNNGTLWAWGYNGNGGLAQSNTTNRSSPVQVGTSSNWTSVSVGREAMAAILNNGTLWVCGYNDVGQLGLGDTNRRLSLVQVGSLSNWLSVSFGQKVTTAIKSDGTLWAWGNNFNGQLGLGDRTNRSSPVQVGTLSSWTQCSSGEFNSAALSSNGTIWSWGCNSFGGLGNNTTTQTNVLTPIQIGNLSSWTKVVAGYFNTAALKNDGTLWICGYNLTGSLGQNNTTNYSSLVQVGNLTTWTNVNCGTYYTLGLHT